jgi:hypothetical protein
MSKPPVRLLLVPSIVSALIFGLGIGLIAFGLAWKNGGIYALQIALVWTGTGIVIGFMWGSLVWTQMLTEIYEPKRIYTKDVDKVEEKLRIEIIDETDGYLNVHWLNFPTTKISLQQLINTGKLLQQNGYNLSHAICGRGKPLARPQFEELRDILVVHGLAKWNNPYSRNQGVSLTPPGKSLFTQLASHQGGPLPQLLKVLDENKHTRVHTGERYNDNL